MIDEVHARSEDRCSRSGPVAALRCFRPQPGHPALAAPGDLIQRVYTDKARYSPNTSATVTVEIKNNTGATWNGTLYLDIRHLGTLTYSTSQSLNVSEGES